MLCAESLRSSEAIDSNDIFADVKVRKSKGRFGKAGMEEGRQESELLIIVRRLCDGNGCNVDVAGESGGGDEHPGTGGRLSYLV